MVSFLIFPPELNIKTRVACIYFEYNLKTAKITLGMVYGFRF